MSKQNPRSKARKRRARWHLWLLRLRTNRLRVRGPSSRRLEDETRRPTREPFQWRHGRSYVAQESLAFARPSRVRGTSRSHRQQARRRATRAVDPLRNPRLSRQLRWPRRHEVPALRAHPLRRGRRDMHVCAKPQQETPRRLPFRCGRRVKTQSLRHLRAQRLPVAGAKRPADRGARWRELHRLVFQRVAESARRCCIH